jgi:hypothetical protein
MPSPVAILEGLHRTANEAWWLALVWHALVSVAGLAIFLGQRPSGRVAGLATATLPISVAVLALAYGNPFNGAAFALLAATLAVVAARSDRAPIVVRADGAHRLGIGLALFGWLYPHFLDASPTAYLVAAPLGLVPCPTLSMMVGLALLGVRPSGRAWPAILVIASLFYGVVGVARLGVWIDLVLVAGALGLALVTWSERSHDRPTHPSAA